MGSDNLMSPAKVGNLSLKHRVVMSAMTRLRNDPITEAAREINKLYYSQRASEGGLIVTEATAPSARGKGYVRAPGMYTDAHIDGWKLITSEVHSKGAYIYAQLLHAGKLSHTSLLPNNQLPVSASAIAAKGEIYIANFKKAPYETPRAMETDEIPGIVAEFMTAAKRAMEAGFDGVEIHGGNGITHQFLAQASNIRTDQYGGSVENRARIVLEIVDGVIEAIGSHKVGIKIQPGVSFYGVIEPEDDSFAQLAYLGPELEKRNLSYVNLASLNYFPYYKFVGLTEPNFKTDVWRYFRQQYKGTLMINGGITAESAEEYISSGTADLVAFGAFFLANANLPELLACGAELNKGGWDMGTWYGRLPEDDMKGYTDWPLVKPVVNAAANE